MKRAYWTLPALLLANAASAQPQLALPVDCDLGRTCFVQNHVDLDPSPAVRDYTCGTLTYDGHNGTDFRIVTLRAMRNGVGVLAAADGRVARLRSDVPDVSVRERGLGAVRGAECGNGLVLEHGNGWETQYCHMGQGSLRVKAGDAVRSGQLLGQIGLSGLTEYPHLHFTVRHQGQVVDPNAFGGPPGSCASGRSLWVEPVKQSLAYRTGQVLNRGFAGAPPTAAQVELDEVPPAEMGAGALVAYVRAIGLRAGDRQRLVLRGPDGTVLTDNRLEALESDKAQFLVLSGRRRPPSGWAPGAYQAHYTVERQGTLVIEERFDLAL